MKCLVCKDEMLTSYQDEGKGMVLERKMVCPNKCYAYNYSYGNIEINVGHYLTFELAYDATIAEAQTLATRIRAAASAIRIAEAYKEFKNPKT